jgi:Uma2 family endonuclease
MSVGTHIGPWTEEDAFALPDGPQRYELLEGTLLVRPRPGGAHQRTSLHLANALAEAETPRLMVTEAVGVHLDDNTMFIPDVLVVARDVGSADGSGVLASAAVALVVEIVSPGSRTTDRVTKPSVYAQAGIPSFWRVELEDGPAIFAYRLERGVYVEAASARPGEHLVVNEPFPISLNPESLKP